MSQSKRKRPEYLGDPTIGRVMLRPRWILALLLALVVAAVFAWLGRWQLEAATQQAESPVVAETARPLADIAEPGAAVSEAAGGAVVTVEGAFEAGDFGVVAPRVNAGESGAWVVAHLRTESPASHLVVALGWAPSSDEAAKAIERLEADGAPGRTMSLEGRYMPSESPVTPHADEDPLSMQTMVPGFVINTWSDVDSPVYAGYLVLHPAGAEQLLEAAELDAIDSVPVEVDQSVNMLNIFYAIEWVVFAGFALFFWYRLTRDAWEKEHELKLLAAEAAETGDPEAQ